MTKLMEEGHDREFAGEHDPMKSRKIMTRSGTAAINRAEDELRWFDAARLCHRGIELTELLLPQLC